MKKILAATGNMKKLKEFREILTPLGFEVLGANEVGGLPEVVEDGETFSANACKKAREIALAKNLPCFADDSGLCVDALDGAPGIFSARYGGPELDDYGRCLKLLNELEQTDTDDRRAHFCCVIALADASGNILGEGEGKCSGNIAMQTSGDEGFGYDPVFVPDNYEKSFAELGKEIKNSMSHRKKALNIVLKKGLLDLL